MSDLRPMWVVDTSVYTHLSRAGHLHILNEVAPAGLILVPAEVHDEIGAGRDLYPGIADPASLAWVELAVLTEDEVFTQLVIKAAMGGAPTDHLGECSVIACAKHRGHVALVDERAAVTQAGLHGVLTHDTLWVVIEAFSTILDGDRSAAIRIVDDLISTGMHLPIESGASLFAWAYEEGLLPR
ncbi:MAG: hypothetical protein IPM08_07110 [Actinomycetales bacterium]|nr:hypothetical protein [Actinomycetales bacterium]